MRDERKMPTWVETASDHSMVSAKELCLWLDVPVNRLKVLMRDNGMPPPRFGSKSRRWRVGDIRAWLKQSSNMEEELAVPVGAPDAKNKEGSTQRRSHDRIMVAIRSDAVRRHMRKH